MVNLKRRAAAEITTLCSKMRINLRQALNPPQQHLQLSIARPRHVLGNLVAGKVNSDPGQSSLCVRGTHYASATDKSDGQFGNVSLREGLVKGIPDCGIVRHVELT